MQLIFQSNFLSVQKTGEFFVAIYSLKTKSSKKIEINSLHLKRALLLVWQSAPRWTLANAFLVVLQGTLPLASLYLMKLIVDSVTVGVNSVNKEATFGHISISNFPYCRRSFSYCSEPLSLRCGQRGPGISGLRSYP